ncbi:uncharacterized protein [Rhodnius prolixus]|uniref:Putative acyl-coa synthetase rhodnius neglectus n=2 Tax=Rhodnius TaxID=13248 RepID=A0A4P6D682_RHOPR
MHKYLRTITRCYSVVVQSPLPQTVGQVTSVHEEVWSALSEHGDRIALTCTQTGRSFKYNRLKQLSTNMACWLQDNYSSSDQGSHVATVLPNSVELAISALGALEAGVPIALFNPHYTSIELSVAFSVGQPKWVITTSDRVHTILEAMSLSGIKGQIVTVDDNITFSKVKHFEELVSEKGTTNKDFGKHGGIVMYNDGEVRKISQKNILANCLQVSQPELSPLEPGDKMAAIIPMWNCHGLTHTLLRGLKSGAEVVTITQLQPTQILATVNKNKVRVLPTLSSMVDWLTRCKKQDLAGLKSITISGRPSSFSDRLGSIFNGELLQSYGPAEGPILFQQRRGSICRAGSVGQLLPGTEARITGPGGNNDLPHNVPGELWVRGPQLGDGKLWMSTGDQGYYDQDGWFYITEQAEMNVDGLKISPTELEAVLKQHENVAEAVIFLADKQLVAAVVPIDLYKPPSCKELNLHLGTQLAPYKHISDLVIMSSLPRDSSGQVSRKHLVENYNPKKELASMSYV